MFEIWTRSNQYQDWTLYGTFRSEAEFKRELPHIRAQGLYTKRVAS